MLRQAGYSSRAGHLLFVEHGRPPTPAPAGDKTASHGCGSQPAAATQIGCAVSSSTLGLRLERLETGNIKVLMPLTFMHEGRAPLGASPEQGEFGPDHW
jgi:hypothetical protein